MVIYFVFDVSYLQEEAEQLYMDCGRYDLLNKFYQASNNWTKVRHEDMKIILCDFNRSRPSSFFHIFTSAPFTSYF